MPLLYVCTCPNFCLSVFLSPETATTKSWCMFSDMYIKRHLVLVAVNEVHCISDQFVHKSSTLCPSMVESSISAQVGNILNMADLP